MRLMILAALAAAVTAFALVPRTAHACSCVMPPGPEEALETYDAVFVGRVHDVRMIERTFPDEEPSSPLSTIYMNEVRVAVETVWKGELGGAATILTGMGGGDCGYSFERARSYLVYAGIDPETGIVGTSICSPTKPLDQADEDIAVLDTLAEPYEPPAASAEELDEWPDVATPSSGGDADADASGDEDDAAADPVADPAARSTDGGAATPLWLGPYFIPLLMGAAGLLAVVLIVVGRRRRENS